MLGNPVTMAASLSSPPPCSTPLITQKPCFRLDLGREFLKSFDLGHQRPLKLRSLESSKELVVSANSNNAVSVTDPAPSLTRITDFGLARLVGSRDSNDSSFVNGDLGEIGYVAPEYSSTMVASLKGDVYGFGVVLLELITGQKPLEISNVVEGFKGNLVDWVSHLSNTGRSVDAIDSL